MQIDMSTQVSFQLYGYLFTAALQSRLFPVLRRSFSARASLYSISRPSLQALRAPLPLQPCVGSLCIPVLRTLKDKRWQVSAKDHNHSCFQFISSPIFQNFLEYKLLDLQQLTGFRPRQTPMHCPLTQKFSTQVFHIFMIPYAC